MLHIRRRSDPTALWAAHGWPPLLRWADRPEVPWLYWALHEVAGAVNAEDVDAVDDLLTEAGLLLERVWTDPPAGARQGDVMSISTGLWAEVQRGRGVTDLTQVALHSRLLRNLVAPAAGQLPTRPALAVPAYRPPEERINGGHLPLAGTGGVRGRELQEQFLLLIATVLSNGGGHLVDHASSNVPQGADPARTGWTRPGAAPAGTRLGSIQTGADGSGDVLLRPGPCLTAVRRRVLVQPVITGADQWSVDDIGWALAGAWLTDTTLILEPHRISRSHTTALPVAADHPAEQVWRLPLAAFHPLQFFPEQERWHRPANPLRPVPTR
jgi:hypothetical protein